MPVYVMLANFVETEKRRKSDFLQNVTEVCDEICNPGARLLARYGDFKHYDIVNVIESKDETTMTEIIDALINKCLVRKLDLMGPYECGRYTDNNWIVPGRVDLRVVKQFIRNEELTNPTCCTEDKNELRAACPVGVRIA